MNASAIRTQRWRPPKPLVGQRVLEKVLNRHTAVSCPESRLLVAVISVAIVDCLSPSNRHLRRQARRFVLGPLFVERRTGGFSFFRARIVSTTYQNPFLSFEA